MALETAPDNTSEGVETVGTGNEARLRILNRINDQNDGDRAEELRNVNDDDTTEVFVVQGADGTQEALTDETVADPETDATIEALAAESDPAPAKPSLVELTVNGRKIQVTQEELIARAQKIEAADSYLEEARRLRAEAQRKPEPAPEPEQNSVDDDLALARAIQMGSEEEAVAALRKIRSSTPSLTKADVAKTIDERLTFNEAIQQFRSEYKDIVSDPVLNRLALDTDAKLIAAGDQRTYAERYKDIGDTLRDWVNKQVQARAPEPTPVVQGEEKLRKKAAAAPVPKGASQKSASSAEEEKEESTSDVIANIAKARGGPQWMNVPSVH